MFKVFASQNVFSGFYRMIPILNSNTSPNAATAHAHHHFSSPLLPFLSLLLVMPLMASLLSSL